MNEHDLPLTANAQDILVTHFILDLKCDLENNVMQGHVMLFLDPRNNAAKSRHVFSTQEYQTSLQKNSTSSSDEKRDCNAASSYSPYIQSCQNDAELSKNLERKEIVAPANEENLSSILTKPTITSDLVCASEYQHSDPLIGKTDDLHETCSKVQKLNFPGYGIVTKSHKLYQQGDLDFTSRSLPSIHTAVAADLQKTETNSQMSRTHDSFSESSWFQVILECRDLRVSHVEEVVLPPDLLQQILESQGCGLTASRHLYLQGHKCAARRPLAFSCCSWSLRLWQPGVCNATDFPRGVCIHFTTVPDGESLRWAIDQDGRPCVYSASMWINNRALFPCQEFGALSTWQVFLTTPESTTALITGDEQSQPQQLSGGWRLWYQENSLPLPSFCLALAVGHWGICQLYPEDNISSFPAQKSWTPVCPCAHEKVCLGTWSRDPVLPCRVIAPESLLPRAQSELQDYYPKGCAAVQKLLGAHPFPHVDILFIPACSQDMAMANPGLIFLSQSLLAGDGSMLVRLGHELSHAWFGLLIGARDWTEEWLSEGFATYIEDAIHSEAMGWSETQHKEHAELRALLRHRVLQGEMATTSDQLQTLRPNQGATYDTGADVTFVKNGMNPNKLFTQVHYLKGYFLLRDLEARIGINNFQALLHDHIRKHHGQLIYSRDFLELVFRKFPALSDGGLSLDQIYQDWLDSAGMPKELKSFSASSDNHLVKQVYMMATLWKKFDSSYRRRRTRKKVKLQMESDFNLQVIALQADQLVLLLEELLTIDKLTNKTLAHLSTTYNIPSRNADIKHRWCELVIKHQYHKAYEDLREFLIEHQAMGVYLYGEMVLSGCRKQKMMAEQCFTQVSPQMETGTRRTVHSMLYGAPD